MNYTKIILSVTGTVGILSGYGIYCYFNPGTDGMIFGSVMLSIGVINGINLTDIWTKRFGKNGNQNNEN